MLANTKIDPSADTAESVTAGAPPSRPIVLVSDDSVNPPAVGNANVRPREGSAPIIDGEPDGDIVGSAVVGDTDGEVVGSEVVGEVVGDVVGLEVVGETDGEAVGSDVVGAIDGDVVGSAVVGEDDGDRVGLKVGETVGPSVFEPDVTGPEVYVTPLTVMLNGSLAMALAIACTSAVVMPEPARNDSPSDVVRLKLATVLGSTVAKALSAMATSIAA